MSDKNVCKHFKVGFCKYGLKCRHKHIIEECQVQTVKSENDTYIKRIHKLEKQLKEKM